MKTTMQQSQDLSSADARLIVLEMSVAALIAQLPRASLEEVASMLCFVAGVTEEVGEVTGAAEDQPLAHVRHWADEMLHRVMASRKADQPDIVGPMLAPGV